MNHKVDLEIMTWNIKNTMKTVGIVYDQEKNLLNLKFGAIFQDFVHRFTG